MVCLGGFALKDLRTGVDVPPELGRPVWDSHPAECPVVEWQTPEGAAAGRLLPLKNRFVNAVIAITDHAGGVMPKIWLVPPGIYGELSSHTDICTNGRVMICGVTFCPDSTLSANA